MYWRQEIGQSVSNRNKQNEFMESMIQIQPDREGSGMTLDTEVHTDQMDLVNGAETQEM